MEKELDEDYHLLSEEDATDHEVFFPRRISLFSKWPDYSHVFYAAFFLSVVLNIITILWLSSGSHLRLVGFGSESTRFAGLTWDTLSEFNLNGPFVDENETLANLAWQDVKDDLGSIALDDHYASSLGLPRAQRFPWDQSKGLYFLNAYHDLHCLKAIRRSMLELRDGRPLGFTFTHSMHCLESLRENTICFADDTPRYTAEQHPGKSGYHQRRQCRDWGKLEAYAEAHTSCWRDINPTEDIDSLLRYRYCPPGSPYNDQIHAIFGNFSTGPDASANT